MFADVKGPSFIFWPVGTGDTTTIVVSNTEVVQIDINDKQMAAMKAFPSTNIIPGPAKASPC